MLCSGFGVPEVESGWRYQSIENGSYVMFKLELFSAIDRVGMYHEVSTLKTVRSRL